ncbi:MAG: NADH-quinone oxidoreductase subunit NuoE [Thermodesulfobacteriota bacterium]|nr:NADH-quinone oxidoreductase subunit NuoE [Thermodesulfobacteriota bacterium]
MADLTVTQSSAALEEFSSEQMDKVDEIIVAYREKPGGLIPVLEQVQEVLGYLPRVVQEIVSKGLNIPVANVYGVVTFYSFFTMVPRGKHVIRVCLGTACYVRGSQKIMDKASHLLGVGPGECTKDRQFSLEAVRCVGVCGLAPVMLVDEDTYGHVEPAKVESILAKYKDA